MSAELYFYIPFFILIRINILIFKRIIVLNIILQVHYVFMENVQVGGLLHIFRCWQNLEMLISPHPPTQIVLMCANQSFKVYISNLNMVLKYQELPKT